MAISSRVIELRFRDPSRKETRFEVERSVGDSTRFVKVASLPASSGSGKTVKYRDTIPQQDGQPSVAAVGTRYYYRVRMFQPGKPIYSGVRWSFTMGPPTGLDIGDHTLISEVSFPLVWNNPAFGEDGVEIEKSEQLNGALQVTLLPRIPGGNVTSALLTSLAPNRYHQIRVRSYHANGVSDWSTQLAFFTPPDFSSITMDGRMLVDTPSLLFPSTSLGGESLLVARVGNLSPDDNTGTSLRLWKCLPTPLAPRNQDPGVRAGFHVGRGRDDLNPTFIDPLQLHRFDVRFRVGSRVPPSVSSVAGRLILYSNDPNQRVVAITLSGGVR